jgi:hypothetical protein
MEGEHVTKKDFNQEIQAESISKARLKIPAGGGTAGTPYPQYDVASAEKWALDWDEKTRRLIQERIENVPPYRFFDPDEARTLEALIDCVLPQEDRSSEDRIPIAPWIDERLYQGEGNGYRYESMPDDGKAYHVALRGLDQAAMILHDSAFANLSRMDQDAVVNKFMDGTIPGSAWSELPAQTFFQQFMGEVITNYYAHPAAWAEIGFNGPASPRGHIRLRLGTRDPWEAKEIYPRSSVEIVRQHLQKRQDRPAQGGPTH